MMTSKQGELILLYVFINFRFQATSDSLHEGSPDHRIHYQPGYSGLLCLADSGYVSNALLRVHTNDGGKG